MNDILNVKSESLAQFDKKLLGEAIEKGNKFLEDNPDATAEQNQELLDDF